MTLEKQVAHDLWFWYENKLSSIDKGHLKLLLQPLNYLIVAKQPGLYQSSDILKIQFSFTCRLKDAFLSLRVENINGERINKLKQIGQGNVNALNF